MTANETETEWLRSSQAAAIFGTSPKTINQWARDGRLPYRRTLGGHRRYPAGQLRAMAAAEREATS